MRFAEIGIFVFSLAFFDAYPRRKHAPFRQIK